MESLFSKVFKAKLLDLKIISYTSEKNYDQTDAVVTLTLEEPVTCKGSTLFDDLATGKRGVAPEVTDSNICKIMASELDKFASEFSTDTDEAGNLLLTGYKGSSLQFDVSKPKVNDFNLTTRRNAELWLTATKFADRKGSRTMSFEEKAKAFQAKMS